MVYGEIFTFRDSCMAINPNMFVFTEGWPVCESMSFKVTLIDLCTEFKPHFCTDFCAKVSNMDNDFGGGGGNVV